MGLLDIIIENGCVFYSYSISTFKNATTEKLKAKENGPTKFCVCFINDRKLKLFYDEI